ncbi:MAG: hypothetical protein HOY71_03285 [Nonomuraea sp.]|nr:hypothetical protein [Nonomuraea sp.]
MNERLLPTEGDLDFQTTDLAPGVRLDQNGWLAGTPERPGTYPAAVELCRGGSCVAQHVTVVVLRNVPWQPGQLTFPGHVGTAMNGEIAVQGGPTGILPTYTVTDDMSMPDGVSIGPDGHVGGVPKQAGVYEVPVRICVAGNCSGVVVTLIVV